MGGCLRTSASIATRRTSAERVADALDTNVLAYLVSADEVKADIAARLLRDGDIVIGVQVLNELVNVLRRKAKLDWPEIERFVESVKRLCAVTPLTVAIHDEGRRLAARYRLSTGDALICAAAIDAGAARLYSEDMQHGLEIDGVLQILDPFRDLSDPSNRA